MGRADLDAEAIAARLQELARLSAAPLEATELVDMSGAAIRDRLITLSEVSALCFELEAAGRRQWNRRTIEVPTGVKPRLS